MDAQDPIQPTTENTANVPAPTLPSTGEAGVATSRLHTDKNKNWLNWVLLGAVFVSLVALLVNIDRSLFVAPQADSVDTTAELKLEMQTADQVEINDQVKLLVRLENNNNNQLTYGADIVVRYNPEVFTFVSANVPATSRNGCVTTQEPAIVLAPVKNVDDCSFNNQTVKDQADTTGVVRFGAVSFVWDKAEEEGYQPMALNASSEWWLAELTFEAKATGSGDFEILHEAGQTNDSNVGVIQNEVVGDSLTRVVNTTANVGGEAPTPTGAEECPATNLSGDAECVIDNDDFQLWVRAYRCSIEVGEAYNIDCDQPGGTDFPSFEVSDADFNGVDGVDFDDLNFIKQALN